MRHYDARELHRQWTRDFKRHGRSGPRTKLFQELEPAQQAFLTAACGLDPDELPVIAHVQSDETWLLLTTERLLVSTDGLVDPIPADEIFWATADMRRPSGKSTTATIWVTTVDGRRHRLDCDPAEPFFGMWNTLLNIARKVSRDRRR